LKIRTLTLPLFFLALLTVCSIPVALAPWTSPSLPSPAKLLWYDDGMTNDIALSKDGQYVASVGSAPFSGELRFYGRSSGTPIWTYTVDDSFGSVAISADGDCVAAGNGSLVFFWKNARSLSGIDPSPTWTSVWLGVIEKRCLDISDDGNYLVAGGTGDQVYYWANAKSKSGSSVVVTWDYAFTPNTDVLAVDLSSDGDYVVAGTFDQRVAYWMDAGSRTDLNSDPNWVSTWPNDIINDVAVSDDGNYVAAAGGGGPSPVYYWGGAKDLSSDPQTKWEGGAGIDFPSLDMSSNGDSVIAGAMGTERGVYFWSGARGRNTNAEPWTWMYPTPGNVWDVAINSAGDYMAAANDAATPYVYFFDEAGGPPKWSCGPLDYEAHVLSISDDGGTLAVGTGGITTSFLISTGYRTARPVGGFLLPADKLALLSPWMTLALAAVAVAVFVAKRRKP